jgi:hypothetical protein
VKKLLFQPEQTNNIEVGDRVIARIMGIAPRTGIVISKSGKRYTVQLDTGAGAFALGSNVLTTRRHALTKIQN